MSLLMLAGCATKPVAMNSSMLDEPDTSVHIVTTKIPTEGKLFRTGSQGLLDLVINSAVTSEVSGFLATKDGAEFNQLVDNVERQFKLKSIPVTRHIRAVDYDSIPKRKADKGEFDKDLSNIFANTDAKYILFLRLVGFGAERSYYSFIPTSDPSGVVLLDGAIVDRDSKLHWFTRDSSALEPRFTRSVIGEWDQPPSYPSLDKSLSESWQLAEDGILTDIFGSTSVSAVGS